MHVCLRVMAKDVLQNLKVQVEDEAHLLYVGMTRAVENLAMTCYEESLFTQQVRQAIELAESSW